MADKTALDYALRTWPEGTSPKPRTTTPRAQLSATLTDIAGYVRAIRRDDYNGMASELFDASDVTVLRRASRELARRCRWTEDGDEGAWRTACGKYFYFEGGGTPSEHGQQFCGYCGGVLPDVAGPGGQQ